MRSRDGEGRDCSCLAEDVGGHCVFYAAECVFFFALHALDWDASDFCGNAADYVGVYAGRVGLARDETRVSDGAGALSGAAGEAA